MTFTLAMIQMTVKGGEKAENLARAEARIAEAAEAGANVVVLPECLDLGWTHPSSRSEAEPIPGGAPYARLATAARRHGVYLCAGLTEKDHDRVFNAAILLDPNGELLLHHRKIYELDIGARYYAVGDRMGVVDTEYGRIGVMICADAFAPGQVITRTLCRMGAKVLLSPSAWAVSDTSVYDADNPYGEIWRENYRPVAAEFGVWIAGVSNVGPVSAGPWAGRHCIGASLLYAPGGQEALQGAYGVEADTIIKTLVDTPD